MSVLEQIKTADSKKRKAGRPVSYQAFLTQLNIYKSQGYAVDKPVTKEEYLQRYHELKRAGTKDPMKVIAKSHISISEDTARNLVRKIGRLKATTRKDASGEEVAIPDEEIAENMETYKVLQKYLGRNGYISLKTLRSTKFAEKASTIIRELGPTAAIASQVSTGKGLQFRSSQQAAFLLTWEVLGSRDAAEASFGY